MNQNIIDLYEVNFENRVYTSKAHGRQIDKFVHTNNDILTSFLFEWNASEIDQYLISDIDDVLNGILPDAQIATDLMTIIINPKNTSFHIDNVRTNYPEIITKDFREILVGWRDFLLTPPLDGTKV